MNGPELSTAGCEAVRKQREAVRKLRMGELELNPTTGELVGPGGTERLDPKVMAVLLLLVRHAGSVLSRDSFLDDIWAGMVVTDDVLSRCVYQLRLHLRRASGNDDYKRLLETLPKRGYRLNCTVTTVSTRDRDEPARRPQRRALAVLFGLLAMAAPLAFLLLRGGTSAELEQPGRSVTSAVLPSTGNGQTSLEQRLVDPQAQQHYLQGRFFFDRRGPGDAERARRHFRRAVELDPGHARGWAGLAGVYHVLLGDVGVIDPADALARFGQAARNAVAADPTLPQAHVRLSQYQAKAGDQAAADQSLRTALVLDPDAVLALAVSAGRAARESRWDEAIQLLRRAIALDPVSVVNRNNLAFYLMRAGRLDEAYQEILILAELKPGPPSPHAPNDEPHGAGLLIPVLILLERQDEALALLQQWPPGNTRDRFLAMIYHALGRVVESDALVARQNEPPAPDELVRMAEVHAFRGDREAAFLWLSLTSERLRADTSLLRGDRRQLLWELAASPFLTSLHQDARWQAWLAENSFRESGVFPADDRPERLTCISPESAAPA